MSVVLRCIVAELVLWGWQGASATKAGMARDGSKNDRNSRRPWAWAEPSGGLRAQVLRRRGEACHPGIDFPGELLRLAGCCFYGCFSFSGIVVLITG